MTTRIPSLPPMIYARNECKRNECSKGYNTFSDELVVENGFVVTRKERMKREKPAEPDSFADFTEVA